MEKSYITRLTVAVLALALLLLSRAPAQERLDTSSTKGAVLKNRAPFNTDLVKAKLPVPVESTLKNGLRVLIVENHRFPTISMQLTIDGAGGLYDPKDLPGIANMTATMLRQGTMTRSSEQISSTLDDIAGSYSMATATGSTAVTITASGFANSFDVVLDLVSDMVLNPAFSEAELNRLVLQQRNALQTARTNPTLLAYERLYKSVYGDQPASVRMTTAEALSKFSPALLRSFHNAHYSASNAVLGISGDITAKDALTKIEKAFGSWRRGTTVESNWPESLKPEKLKICLIDRPNSVQSSLVLGNLSTTRTSPDYVSLLVMNYIVATRLFRNLGENGYSYNATSTFSATQIPGVWRASLDVRNEATDRAMKEVMSELNRIRAERVPTQELDEAKNSIVARFALSLEDPNTILTDFMQVKTYQLPNAYWNSYTDRVSTVTSDEIQKMAGKYIDLPRLTIVAVGDAGKIKAIMSKYGDVEMYNIDGQQIGN